MDYLSTKLPLMRFTPRLKRRISLDTQQDYLDDGDSMAIPTWLIHYYGKDFKKFNPTLVSQGKRWAIVRVQGSKDKESKAGFSQVGYILIKVNGKHNISEHVSLHEGQASESDMERMTKVLSERDSDGR